MAETPLCAYAVVDSAPGLVLTVLYRHAPATEVRAYLGGAKHPPLARCGVGEVRACLPRMSRTQIFANLSTLRQRGLIRDEAGGFLLLARESGKPDCAHAPGIDLVEQFALLHEPEQRHRAFVSTSRRHVDLALQLLAAHPQEVVLGIARDFVQVIRSDHAHEARWRPAMMRPEIWVTVRATVDAWRRERAEEEAAAAAALARQQEAGLMSQAYELIYAALRSCKPLLQASGYEADDARQEILLIFTQRLRGRHPYDVLKSPLRSYIFMLTRSVLLNRIARAGRRRRALGVLAAHHRDRHAELDIEALLAEGINPPPSGDREKNHGAPTAGPKTALGAKTIPGPTG